MALGDIASRSLWPPPRRSSGGAAACDVGGLICRPPVVDGVGPNGYVFVWLPDARGGGVSKRRKLDCVSRRIPLMCPDQSITQVCASNREREGIEFCDEKGVG